MKLTELWQIKRKPTLSFEIFPAKTPKGAESLGRVIDELLSVEPDFVAVTFGAGGSTREGSLEWVNTLMHDKNVKTIAYFIGYGLGPEDILGILDRNREAGVENVLVVRGDPPQEESFQPHRESFSHASDLLAGVPGIHLYTMDRSESVRGIVRTLKREGLL